MFYRSLAILPLLSCCWRQWLLSFSYAVRQMQFSYTCICRTIMLVDWIVYKFLHWWTRTWICLCSIGVKIIAGTISPRDFDIVHSIFHHSCIFIRLIRCTYAKKNWEFYVYTVYYQHFDVDVDFNCDVHRKIAIYSISELVKSWNDLWKIRH